MSWWSSPLYVVLVGLAGIIVWHLFPRRRSSASLIVQICFFLTMSVLLLDGAVVPYEPPPDGTTTAETILIGAAKLLWWAHLAWALIGFVRIYLVIERKPREARLLQDLVVGVVYVGALLSVLAFVLGMPIGALIATSGVFAIILGLALQNTLSDLFSGIALNLGRPYVLGDWIVLSDGTEGRVVETNWRSTHLLNLSHNVVALPNSFLAKLGLTNVSRPDESHGLSLTVRLAPTKTPAIATDVMHAALESCDTILKSPPPLVIIRNLDAVAIELELAFRVANVDQRIKARNEIFDLVHRHARSTGLQLALPPSSLISTTGLQSEETAAAANWTAVELIKAIPIFSALTDEEQVALAATATLRAYRKGDIIVRRGEMLPSLIIVRTGVVARLNDDGAVQQQEVGHLAPGDFFGGSGLVVAGGEAAMLRAANRVVVLEIDQQSFAPLLLERPEFAEDLAAVLVARMSDFGEADHGEPHRSSKSALLNAVQTVSRAVPFRRVLSAGRKGAWKGENHDHPVE